MLVSANKAKELWCPHGRIIINHQSNPTFNRVWFKEDKANGKDAYCSSSISRCMANKCASWRWATPKTIRDIDLVTGDIENQERLGYCGLSGPATNED